MNIPNKISLLTLALLTSLFAEIQAYTPKPELVFQAGWRRDNFKQNVDQHVPPTTAASAFINSKAKNIDYFEMGVRGSWALPSFWNGFYFDCDTWWISQFYIRGSAYWGRTNSGHWKQTSNAIPATTPLNVAVGRLYHGRSREYDIAVGWMYPVCGLGDDFGLGAVAGYSYDFIQFKVHHLTNPPNTPNTDPSLFNGEQIKSGYQGPFVGLDFRYEWRKNILISAGYEYHIIIKWNGNANFPTTATNLGIVSTHGFARKGYGNVFYLNADWYICDTWILGLGFKYRYFQTRDGHQEPNGGFAANFQPPQHDSLSAKLTTYGIEMNLGYYF